MKKVVFQVVISVLCLSAQAQKVSNIRAEQRGQDIVVFYSLESNSPCEVILLLSQDNGSTWSAPLKSVSGDVGKNISAGEKQIIWTVLEEQEYLVGDKMKFKVIAIDKKSFEPEMVFVEGGTFQIKDNRSNPDESQIQTITLPPFYIGKFEITQAQWKAVMGSNPSRFFWCANCPVEQVTWEDTQEFIKRLNAKTGKLYRLPTCLEWEYAARGGNVSQGFLYAGSNDLNLVSWNKSNSEKKSHAVGGKQANELGIYDLSGNVKEWMNDMVGVDTVFSNATPNLLAGTRVLRGGSWYDSEETYEVTNSENFINPGYINKRVGFRIVLLDHLIYKE